MQLKAIAIAGMLAAGGFLSYQTTASATHGASENPIARIANFTVGPGSSCIEVAVSTPGSYPHGEVWYWMMQLYRWDVTVGDPTLVPVSMIDQWQSIDKPGSHQEEVILGDIVLINESEGYNESQGTTSPYHPETTYGVRFSGGNLSGDFLVVSADADTVKRIEIRAYSNCQGGIVQGGAIHANVTAESQSSNVRHFLPTDFHGLLTSYSEGGRSIMVGTEAKTRTSGYTFASFHDSGRIGPGLYTSDSILSWKGPTGQGAGIDAHNFGYLVALPSSPYFITGPAGDYTFTVHSMTAGGHSGLFALVIDAPLPE